MCTVTFFRKNKTDFVLTSNRDEAPHRISLEPKVYTINNTNALYPKDAVAGGTWIGTSEKSRTLCVLNGGFKAHERLSDYRLSRGLIVRDLLLTDDLFNSIERYELLGVEPFTLIIVLHNIELQLFQLVWDGSKKHLTELSLEPRLWSSSSLYNSNMKMERKQWFQDFVDHHNLDAETIYKFHTSAGNGNLDYGVIMDRHYVKTTSITQIEMFRNEVKMSYTDLSDNKNTSEVLKLQKHIER